jgi:hypothetical protein
MKARRHFSVIEIPFSGDGQLFEVSPSSGYMYVSMQPVEIRSERLIVEYPTANTTHERINAELGVLLNYIKSSLSTMKVEVQHFETTFRQQVIQAVTARKKQILDQEKLVASLNIPIKQVSSVPTSLVIPGITQRKLVVPKPIPSPGPYNPEYKLDDSIYREILRICQDLGVHMERHPSLYAAKDEEALRDMFLLMLSPHFHSTAGEVFNKTGKTDILIRHDEANVFVAECKFWKGESEYFATIDQLLKYLTHRDSKAAVLLFNTNKNHDPVLQKIQKQSPKHSCFVSPRNSAAEGIYLYNMRLPNDETRGVELAVLCFHFPDPL